MKSGNQTPLKKTGRISEKPEELETKNENYAKVCN